MANSRYTQFFYTKHAMPMLIDCNFIVDADNVNGLGIRSLVGPGVSAVYMHTSATPLAGNPNPAAGFIYVKLQDNFYKYYAGYGAVTSPQSGSSILVASAGVVAGTTYVITILGTTTTAGWQSLGLPVGITPALGVPFVATATTTATGTGAVQVPHANGAGISYIEAIGSGSLTLGPSGLGRTSPYLIFRTMGATDASTTTPIAVAPREESIISLAMYVSNSSVVVAGE